MVDKKIRSAYAKGISGNIITGAIGSTVSVDRDGDVIDPMGIDITNFMKNPQLLWSHDAYALPVGKITNVRIGSTGLEFDAEFASDIDPFAKKVRDMMDGGFLNAFSIGFIPLERMNERIVKCELLEISVVNIPANPEALMSREYKLFEYDISDKENKGTKPLKKQPKEVPKIKKKKIIKRIIKKNKPKSFQKLKTLKKLNKNI